MIELALKAILSYLLGGIMGGLVLGRLRGVDIRSLGSGNAGSTNALRTQGASFALAVMIIDVGKGWLATRIVPAIALPFAPAAPDVHAWVPSACGAAAMLGHVYPVWYGFRGGKAVATFLGAVLGLAPRLLLPVLSTWLAVAVLTGYVGLASMAAALALPIGTVLTSGLAGARPLLAFAVFAALLIVVAHRTNIRRMSAGREPRARRLWLFGLSRGDI
jgi:acyl phosphate:glycerol-3-phosphate acyltransferase